MSALTRWRWISMAVFVASLALNAVLIWMLLSSPPRLSVRSAAPVAALQRVGESLPEADRKLLRSAIVKRSPALRTAQQRYEQEAQHALSLISKEPLDMAALEAAIAGARDARGQAVDELLGAVFETLPGMSAEARRTLAEAGRRGAGGEE